MGEKFVLDSTPDEKSKQEFALKDTFRMPERFKVLNRVVMRDLNRRDYRPTFKKYTKEQILDFLEDPYTYENSCGMPASMCMALALTSVVSFNTLLC